MAKYSNTELPDGCGFIFGLIVLLIIVAILYG